MLVLFWRTLSWSYTSLNVILMPLKSRLTCSLSSSGRWRASPRWSSGPHWVNNNNNNNLQVELVGPLEGREARGNQHQDWARQTVGPRWSHIRDVPQGLRGFGNITVFFRGWTAQKGCFFAACLSWNARPRRSGYPPSVASVLSERRRYSKAAPTWHLQPGPEG